MKVSSIPISKEDIKKKIDIYNSNYDELLTRKNILIRVVAKCTNQSEHTLI